MDILTAIIEELSIDGPNGVSLGRCARSTAYRWKNKVNEVLEAEQYDWCVKLEYHADSRLADLIPIEA